MTTIMPDQEDMGLGWAHVRPQPYPHGPARIIGNRKALEQLQYAIEAALAGVEAPYAEVFARDGEGYQLQVQMVSVLDSLGDPRYAGYEDWAEPVGEDALCQRLRAAFDSDSEPEKNLALRAAWDHIRAHRPTLLIGD